MVQDFKFGDIQSQPKEFMGPYLRSRGDPVVSALTSHKRLS